jgi:hypothetical protein
VWFPGQIETARARLYTWTSRSGSRAGFSWLWRNCPKLTCFHGLWGRASRGRFCNLSSSNGRAGPDAELFAGGGGPLGNLDAPGAGARGRGGARRLVRRMRPPAGRGSGGMPTGVDPPVRAPPPRDAMAGRDARATRVAYPGDSKRHRRRRGGTFHGAAVRGPLILCRLSAGFSNCRPAGVSPAPSPDGILLIDYGIEPLGQVWMAGGAGIERHAAASRVASRRVGTTTQQ